MVRIEKRPCCFQRCRRADERPPRMHWCPEPGCDYGSMQRSNLRNHVRKQWVNYFRSRPMRLPRGSQDCVFHAALDSGFAAPMTPHVITLHSTKALCCVIGREDTVTKQSRPLQRTGVKEYRVRKGRVPPRASWEIQTLTLLFLRVLSRRPPPQSVHVRVRVRVHVYRHHHRVRI
jgi:hypothetical protein